MSVQRAKGTAFETSLLELLRSYYPEAMRRPLQGVNDMGDFYLGNEKRYILSAKNHRRMALAEWVDESDRLAANFNPQAVGVVVHKRKGKGRAEDQYVTLTLDNFLYLINRTT